MAQVEIPQRLIDLTKARRIIPFIGAGFSAGLNIPDWDGLLSKLAEDLDGALPYQEVKKLCNGDNLQIAEYYFLVSDHRIGPLRHTISSALQNNINTLLSAPHVELLNLGAPQIYTTNYDDLIERTFKALKQPVEVIALPKDVATSSEQKTQVVKYHGDLRHEQTLVLTESSYYARLDLDSPMDLKFRSDLLGRSVLFMGYSFRDINIRIIWFKLMGMMRDVAPEDRPTSYIVTFAHNPVRERLYDEVGIKTICLDREGKAETSEARTKLLSDFLARLASATSHEGHIPGQTQVKLFYSTALTDAINRAVQEREQSLSRRLRPAFSQSLDALLAEAARRSIPSAHQSALEEILSKIYTTTSSPDIAITYLKRFGAHPMVTATIARGLEGQPTRDAILEEQTLDWSVVWGAKIPESAAFQILARFERELEGHENKDIRDHDLAYCCDVARRLVSGQILDTAAAISAVKKANSLLAQATQMYQSVGVHSPVADKAPDVSAIAAEIDASKETPTVPAEDDVPF